MAAHSSIVWIVDSVATEYVARILFEFVEYCHTAVGSLDIKLENEARVEVLCIGTYKLDLRAGHSFAPQGVIHS